MLRFARALGFLAPLAITLCASVVLVLTSSIEAFSRPWILSAVLLAALAGMTTTALVAWSYMGWRLNRLAGVLESTLTQEDPIKVKEAGIPAERRLARAFNTATRAFLQFEARATHDRLTGVANRETLLTVLLAETERASRHYKPLSTSTASSRSTTPSATTAATPSFGRSRTSSSTTSGHLTSSAAMAARSSC